MTLKRLDLGQWNEIIAREEETFPFLTGEFLTCLEKYTKAKMELFGFYQGTQIIAYMPAFKVKVGPINTLFSPPYDSGIPSLGYFLPNDFGKQKQSKKEGILKIIAEDLMGEIHNNRIQYANVMLDSQNTDIRSFLWQGFKVEPSYDYRIPLARHEEEIWDSFKKEARKEISTAEKQGIIVKRDVNVDHFWRLEESRYREQGIKTPLFSKDYVKTLIDVFPNSFHLYYALDSKNDVVCSVILFVNGKKVFLWLGNTRAREGTYANEIVIWELIKKYRNDGFEEIIIIGANQERLCKFKSKFDPTPILKFSIIYQTVLGKLMSSTYRKVVKQM